MEQQDSLFELQVDHQSSAFLRETAKWAKFLSILGFVVIGLVTLGFLFARSLFMGSMEVAYGSAVGQTMSIVFILIMLIYFFPTLFLFRFSVRMQTALRNNDQETLNSSFESLKSCFKFIGILMIVILSIYALLFIIGLFAAASI